MIGKLYGPELFLDKIISSMFGQNCPIRTINIQEVQNTDIDIK